MEKRKEITNIFLLEETVFKSTAERSRNECNESSNALVTAGTTCTSVGKQRKAAHVNSGSVGG